MPAASVDMGSHRDRGSVLLLFPAAVLVVLILGSLAVDTALVHLRQRELVDAADAAASDAATLAIDLDRYRRTGDLQLDPTRAERAVHGALAARGVLDDLTAPPSIRLVDATTIEVTLTGRAPHLLASVVPGAPRSVRIAGHGSAKLAVG